MNVKIVQMKYSSKMKKIAQIRKLFQIKKCVDLNYRI